MHQPQPNTKTHHGPPKDRKNPQEETRLANALRMAAQSLHRSKAVLGDWFRRLKAKL